jgi:hypothetical protein
VCLNFAEDVLVSDAMLGGDLPDEFKRFKRMLLNLVGAWLLGWLVGHRVHLLGVYNYIIESYTKKIEPSLKRSWMQGA